jgi:hypothetical protein
VSKDEVGKNGMDQIIHRIIKHRNNFNSPPERSKK